MDIARLLEVKHDPYNRNDFIHTDPIQIPHRFTRREDIEISGFLTCTIAWGKRKTIINNAGHLMELMDNSPYDFSLFGIGMFESGENGKSIFSV